jgi:hypothetical protein
MSDAKADFEAKTPLPKKGVQFDWRGVPYVDIYEVIDSELARIRREKPYLTIVNERELTNANSGKNDDHQRD